MKKLIPTFLLFLTFFLFYHKLIYCQFNFHNLKTEYTKGVLSYRQYLEYSALTLFEPDKLPQEFIQSRDTLPLKSATFLVHEIKTHWGELSPSVQKIVVKHLQRPELDYSLLSPSNRFRIHYNTTGFSAVLLTDNNKNDIPDYVESAGQFFDYAYFLLVDSLGYKPHAPDSSGLGKEFDIYLVNIAGAYGLTYLEELVPGRTDAYSCYMNVENDFRGFKTPPLQALQVTSAHEYYHAIQVNYAFRDEDVFFMEMCSTWMEDFAHNEVNDYLLYLGSFFNHPNYPFSYANGSYEYGAGLWNHMIAKKYGPDPIRNMWENITFESAMTSIPKVLLEYNTNFNEELSAFGLWNYFTNIRNDELNFYPEGALYPEVHFNKEDNNLGENLSFETQMSKLSSSYFKIEDSIYHLTIGLIITNFELPVRSSNDNYDPNDKADLSINLITFDSESPAGDADFFIRNNLVKLSDNHGIRLNVDHQENWFARAVVTKTNGDYEIIQFYPTYSIEDSDKKNFIENIYPSPFVIGKNELLRVRYVVSEENSGEIDIFSSDGRLMKKLNFDSPKYNYHIFQWDGRNENGNFVGSGIYVIVLRVGNFIDIKKLALIRN